MRTPLKAATVFASLLALAVFANPVAAAPKSHSKAPQFGKTLPPIGFVKFCIEHPTECTPTSQTPEPLELTQEQWTTLYQVNTFVNGQIAPVSDMELYGQAEYWTYPTVAGDCEDYLLLKKRYLESMGFPTSALLITVVLDEKKEGHAVLTVATADGDYVLDNRRNEVMGWADTGYVFLKRQSHAHPKQWVSLANKKAESPVEMASK